jgi:hypothetical protein
MTGTFSALIWSISAATSFGVGSSKFSGWIAPMTFQSYVLAKYAYASW